MYVLFRNNTYYLLLINMSDNKNQNKTQNPCKGTIVVGGGTGFIGSHLCDKLVEDYHVIAIDNLSSESFENIKYILQNPQFEFVKHDLTTPLDLDETPEGKRFETEFKGVDCVFHLSTQTAPSDFLKDPVRTAMASALVTKVLLDVAKKYNAKFILGSTGLVYGLPKYEGQVFNEEYSGHVSTIEPLSCHLEGRRFAETLTINYRRQYNIDAKIARIFNAYGPRMKLGDGKDISDFVKSAISDKPLVIYGDNKTTVSLCHISDVVSALIMLMHSDEIGPINIGNPEVYSLAEVAEAVIDLVGSKSKIEYQQIMKYRMREGAPDIRKAKDRLNWLPLTPIEKGLAETVSALRASKIVEVDYSKIASEKVEPVKVPKNNK